MDSTIPLLSKSKISRFQPSSVLVQLGLCRTWLKTTLLVFPRGGSNQAFHIIINIFFMNRIKGTCQLYVNAIAAADQHNCFCHKAQTKFFSRFCTFCFVAKTKFWISIFVFATRLVQFFFFLNPNFQASLRLYRPFSVEPGHKLGRPVFLHCCSFCTLYLRIADFLMLQLIFESCHEKNRFLPMRKQRRKSAVK